MRVVVLDSDKILHKALFFSSFLYIILERDCSCFPIPGGSAGETHCNLINIIKHQQTVNTLMDHVEL